LGKVVHKDLLDLKGLRDQLVILVLLEFKDHRVQPVHKDCKDYKEGKDHQVVRDLLDYKV
jgi:hypothetical protein